MSICEFLNDANPLDFLFLSKYCDQLTGLHSCVLELIVRGILLGRHSSAAQAS